MATVTINGVSVEVRPGEVARADSAGNISVSKSSDSQGSAEQRPNLGRVVVEGAALGVGVGVGVSIGESIADGIGDIFS